MNELEQVKDFIVALLKIHKSEKSDSDFDRGVECGYEHVLEIINAHLKDKS